MKKFVWFKQTGFSVYYTLQIQFISINKMKFNKVERDFNISRACCHFEFTMTDLEAEEMNETLSSR